MPHTAQHIITSSSAPSEPTPTDRLRNNLKRNRALTSQRKQNMGYHAQITPLMRSVERIADHKGIAPGEENQAHPFLSSFQKALCTCASNSLYRKSNSGNEVCLMTPLVCNHRFCNVCNPGRAAKLRKGWTVFLSDETMDVPLSKVGETFFGLWEKTEKVPTLSKIDRDTGEVIEKNPVTVKRDKVTGKPKRDKDTGELQYKAKVSKSGHYTSGAIIARRFDMMHLTLTVPHRAGGWRGVDFYAPQLLEAFNEMRKAKWWVRLVFGGEYTVEVTNGEGAGLHVHIHALLFVDKYINRSRNKLYAHIMRRWNALTVDEGNPRSQYLRPEECPADKERADGFRKSFASMSDSEYADHVLSIDWRGSTLVGLKSLYHEVTREEADRKRYPPKTLFEENGKLYHYCRAGSMESTMKGVLECLKYHFEPCVLENEDGVLDLVMLQKVLPAIYKKRLYGKFGGFYGVSRLNVMEDPLNVDDLLTEAAANAQEAYDPATGQPAEATEYHYVVADARHIRFHKEKPLAYLPPSMVKHMVHTHGGSSGLGAAIAALVLVGYGKRTKDWERHN